MTNFLHEPRGTDQVEAMREKIRILEGIWGEDDDNNNNRPTEKRGQRRGVTDRRRTANTRKQEGTPGETVELSVREERSRKRDGEPRDGDSVVDEEEGVSREGESSGAAPEAGHAGEDEKGSVEVEDGEGEGERGGDAGVDAWLISYNRRLKGELERLRGRTREAEDRCVV